MLLVIDNYDSFVHNLARYCTLAGWDCRVARNDALGLEDIAAMNPQAIVLSPGPCTPKEAGICVEAVRAFGARIPILGVCLGHQCIGEAYGAATTRAPLPVHGRASAITHDGTGLFESLPSPMPAGRYHSLRVALPESGPLKITARAQDEIMAIAHETQPVYGVQFHPESVLTPHGQALIGNFTAIAMRRRAAQAQAA